MGNYARFMQGLPQEHVSQHFLSSSSFALGFLGGFFYLAFARRPPEIRFSHSRGYYFASRKDTEKAKGTMSATLVTLSLFSMMHSCCGIPFVEIVEKKMGTSMHIA